MIEVVTKADLLADFLGSADQKSLEQEPAALEAGAKNGFILYQRSRESSV